MQLGSVWLPLLHILEIPFVSISFLWHTGLAGSIVSSISFIISAVLLYKLIVYITKNTYAGVAGVLVFTLNANLLYLQTTAMFEPLLIATSLGTVYFLTKWTNEQRLYDLLIAAFCTFLATLTRYDGWAYFLATSVYVIFVGLTVRKKKWDGPFLIYSVLGGFGIFLWFIYNKLIFSDALFFMRSEYSAAAQQQILYMRHQLPAKHDLFLSFQTYGLSTALNLGVVVTVVAVIGIVVYLLREKVKVTTLTPLLLLIPFLFNIVSLFMGQSVIWLPTLPPHFQSYFNARYGILMLPAAAFFIGYLVSYKKLFIPIILVILLQLGLFLHPASFKQISGGIITLQDTVSSVNAQTLAASGYLHDNYKQGLILVSSASSDSFIFRANLPMHDFITEGTGEYWKQSLLDPSRYANWIVFFNDTTDRVGSKIVGYKPLKTEYTKVYTNQTYQIWEKKKQIETQ